MQFFRDLPSDGPRFSQATHKLEHCWCPNQFLMYTKYI